MQRPRARCIRCALLGVIATCAITLAADAQPVILAPDTGVRLTQVIATYDVTGKTVRELRASIAAQAPRAPNGARFSGFTTWELNWSFAASELQSGGCLPLGVTVYLRLWVRYPDWKDSSSTPRPVRAAWNRYLTGLKAHENNHAAIAIRGANLLSSELRALATPACSALQEQAQALATEAARRIRADNDLYDERTGHGAAEGVRLVSEPRLR